MSAGRQSRIKTRVSNEEWKSEHVFWKFPLRNQRQKRARKRRRDPFMNAAQCSGCHSKWLKSHPSKMSSKISNFNSTANKFDICYISRSLSFRSLFVSSVFGKWQNDSNNGKKFGRESGLWQWNKQNFYCHITALFYRTVHGQNVFF